MFVVIADREEPARQNDADVAAAAGQYCTRPDVGTSQGVDHRTFSGQGSAPRALREKAREHIEDVTHMRAVSGQGSSPSWTADDQGQS